MYLQFDSHYCQSVSTREEVASILVDALSSIGAAEFEYSYTGIATERPYPEAFVFDEDGRTLRMIFVVGIPSKGIPRKIDEKATMERGFTENAKIPLTALARTEKKLIPNHLDLPANRGGRSIVTADVLNPVHALNPRINRWLSLSNLTSL